MTISHHLLRRVALLFGISMIFSFQLGCSLENKRKVPNQFDVYEVSINEFHEALKNEEVTVEEVVRKYLDRIHTYDEDSTGTALHSIISLNKDAIKIARRLDTDFSLDKLEKYPLYGVPIIIKDNINTKSLPTSGGAIAFKNNQPTTDAYIVKKLKESGAIIIGKANLSEFAFDYVGESSLGGIVKNAYDLTKGAGGSSSGTATAVASNLAMVGIGTDTGGSIRIPSSLAGLIGIRPSMNLISQNGIMPLSPWQDTAGPMCRSVEDCAIVLQVIMGFDTLNYRGNQRIKYNIHSRLINNEKEYNELTGYPFDYRSFLNIDGLKGAKIGVIRELFGEDSIAKFVVNPVINAAIDSMRKAGAIVRDVKVTDLGAILKNYSSMSSFEFKNSLEQYLNSWSRIVDEHILDYDELMTSDGYLPSTKGGLEYRGTYDLNQLTDDQLKIYKKNTEERPTYVRKRILGALDNLDSPQEAFDVLLYPTITGVASNLGENTNAGLNNRLSPFSGLPALTMPAGMVANNGVSVPVGIEMLAREYDESILIKLAYAYEKLFCPRKPPNTSPRL